MVNVVAIAAALIALAPTPAELLARGQTELDALDYDLAAATLAQAAAAPDASDQERLQAHLLAGFANRIIGHDVDAELDFRYVLTRVATMSLPPSAPPKVRTFFEAVRAEVESERRQLAPIESAAQPAASPHGPGVPWGTVFVVGGAGIVLVAGATTSAAEIVLADPHKRGSSIDNWQAAGVTGTVGALAGLVVVGVGAVLWGFGT